MPCSVRTNHDVLNTAPLSLPPPYPVSGAQRITCMDFSPCAYEVASGSDDHTVSELNQSLLRDSEGPRCRERQLESRKGACRIAGGRIGERKGDGRGKPQECEQQV